VPAALQTYQALLASANGNTPAGYTPLTASGKVNSITGQPCSSGITCVQGTNVTNLPIALVASIVLSAGIHLVSVLVPQLRDVFKTYELSGFEWIVLVALSAAIVPMIEVFKALQRSGVVGRDLGPMSRRA
jgi:hypothetical protein